MSPLHDGLCECGEPATTTWDEGYDFAFWTNQPRLTPVCAECWLARDNAAPPDPDGEAFRGRDAVDYQAKLQEHARRLK